MANKQPPYQVITTVPEGYKLPKFFWEMMIKAAVEEVKRRNAGIL